MPTAPTTSNGRVGDPAPRKRWALANAGARSAVIPASYAVRKNVERATSATARGQIPEPPRGNAGGNGGGNDGSRIGPG